jgi:hypothetical protein
MIWELLILFYLKHYISDFCLQTPWMLGKFEAKWKDFITPLAFHASVPATITLLIVYNISPNLWWLAIIDFVSHFFIDRIKASPNLLGQFKPMPAPDKRDFSNKEKIHNFLYWNSIGLDQMAHHIVDLGIVWMLVKTGQ